MSTFIESLKEEFNINFNKQQAEAVEQVDGPKLILATAGAGKTTVMLCRTANLILNYGIAPDSIYSMTFSKAAAIEMEKRFNKMFGNLIEQKVSFSTIHSFAFRVLKQYEKRHGLRHILIDLENSPIKKNWLLRKIHQEINGEIINDDKLNELANKIGFVKNMMIPIEKFKELDFEILHFEEIYIAYENYKNNYANGFSYEEIRQGCTDSDNNNEMLIDFDDMLTLTYKYLKEDTMLLNFYRNKYQYIQLDEFQDTSPIQYEIIKLLVYPNNNLFCIGDDDQTIYSFRGSEPGLILGFKDTFSDGQVFYMEQNYRSSQQIVSMANMFIKNNKNRYDKKIFTENEPQKDIEIQILNDEKEQIEYVIKKIEENNNLKNNAILFRNNISVIPFINRLDKKRIPFYIRDHENTFFKSWVIEDIFKILKLANNQNDWETFKEIYYKMNLFISKAIIQQVDKTVNKNKTVFDNMINNPFLTDRQKENLCNLQKELNFIITKKPLQAIIYIEKGLGYENYLKSYAKKFNYSMDNIQAIISTLKLIASEFNSINELFNRMEELKRAIKNSSYNRFKEAITLSTIHSSKGLEWEKVYIIDMINDIFPSKNAVEESKEGDFKQLEEERRLAYVGITRAREELYLLSMSNKNNQKVRSSLFLNEVKHILNPSIKQKYSDTISINKQLEKGQKVIHSRFGNGTIEEVSTDIVGVKFECFGFKRLAKQMVEQGNMLKIVG